MCCFSRPVEHVNATRIFARPVLDGRQVIVYTMTLSAPEPLAMILPIPTRRGAGEDAVQFVSLLDYRHLFSDIERGFPEPETLGPLGRSAPAAGGGNTLRVVQVGSFVASFVPRVADFERLDSQFRLPAGVWEKLPQYGDFGFAVFRLKSGRARIHPMAFTFPTAIPGKLFFPTVHIHDGVVHREAEFDHALYCQVTRAGQRAMAEWNESAWPASRFVNVKQANDLVVADRHIYRRTLSGVLPNQDVLLEAA